MAQASDRDRLRHMLDFAEKARELSKDRKRGDLDTDEMFALAMARLLEVIGEAASRVSQTFQGRHPEIPWKLIIGLRNRLIHGYDTIDPDITWQILTKDLSPLIESLEKILANGVPKTRKPKET